MRVEDSASGTGKQGGCTARHGQAASPGARNKPPAPTEPPDHPPTPATPWVTPQPRAAAPAVAPGHQHHPLAGWELMRQAAVWGRQFTAHARKIRAPQNCPPIAGVTPGRASVRLGVPSLARFSLAQQHLTVVTGTAPASGGAKCFLVTQGISGWWQEGTQSSSGTVPAFSACPASPGSLLRKVKPRSTMTGLSSRRWRTQVRLFQTQLHLFPLLHKSN